MNSDKNISWLIYLQIKVKFQLMVVEMHTAPHSSSRSTSNDKGFYYKEATDNANAGNADSRSSSVNSTDGGGSRHGKKGNKSKKTSFLGQLDDFF